MVRRPEDEKPEQHDDALSLGLDNLTSATLLEQLTILPDGHFELRDKFGETYIATFVEPEDCAEISAIVRQNFDEAPSYANLTDEARERYKEANTPEGILETSLNENNIVSLVVRDGDGKVVGYRIVRKGELRYEWEGREANSIVAEGKRMHIARGHEGKGLGTALLHLSEELVLARGHQIMVVNASGDSYHFFMQAGYEVIAHEENPVLASDGVRANRTYLAKNLLSKPEMPDEV